jgi:8-amino-7-oxononanoate synthase
MGALDFIDAELAEISAAGLARDNVSIDSAQGPVVARAGHHLVNLSSNDTLSLAAHPEVREAAAAAAREFGAGSGASRLLGGDLPIHRELEAALAELKGTESALLFPSGYHANTGVIPALVDAGDAVFSDALNHASIIDGCRLSRADRHVYRHLDLRHLSELLRTSRARRKLIVTDSLFSMDGDAAPLEELCELAEEYGALLMVDEAHATGVYGDGAGLCAEWGVDGRVAVQMGTLGKALGAAGAYIAGEARLIRFLLNRCRSYIFTTAPPPAVCAAALRAIRIVRSAEGEALREQLLARAHQLSSGLRRLGLPCAGGDHHFMAVVVGEPGPAVHASLELEARGYLIRAVRPPTVPPRGSRLRLSPCAGHTEAQIDGALAALADVLASPGPLAGGAP